MMLGRIARIPIIGFIELFRGLPVIITIVFVWRAFVELGIDVSVLPGVDGLWYLVIGLTLYNSVIIAEILRAGVASLPRGPGRGGARGRHDRGPGHAHGAAAAGLPDHAARADQPARGRSSRTPRWPPSSGLYIELLDRGNQIALNLDNPIQSFFVVGLIFIVINYALSRLAIWVEAPGKPRPGWRGCHGGRRPGRRRRHAPRRSRGVRSLLAGGRHGHRRRPRDRSSRAARRADRAPRCSAASSPAPAPRTGTTCRSGCPAGVRAIAVSLRLQPDQHAASGSRFNVVDIGIFDPSGHGARQRPGLPGLVRRRAPVVPDSAGPARRRATSPGRSRRAGWHIVLGPYLITPPGTPYKVVGRRSTSARRGPSSRPTPAPTAVPGTRPGLVPRRPAHPHRPLRRHADAAGAGRRRARRRARLHRLLGAQHQLRRRSPGAGTRPTTSWSSSARRSPPAPGTGWRWASRPGPGSTGATGPRTTGSRSSPTWCARSAGVAIACHPFNPVPSIRWGFGTDYERHGRVRDLERAVDRRRPDRRSRNWHADAAAGPVRARGRQLRLPQRRPDRRAGAVGAAARRRSRPPRSSPRPRRSPWVAESSACRPRPSRRRSARRPRRAATPSTAAPTDLVTVTHDGVRRTRMRRAAARADRRHRRRARRRRRQPRGHDRAGPASAIPLRARRGTPPQRRGQQPGRGHGRLADGGADQPGRSLTSSA